MIMEWRVREEGKRREKETQKPKAFEFGSEVEVEESAI